MGISDQTITFNTNRSRYNHAAYPIQTGSNALSKNQLIVIVTYSYSHAYTIKQHAYIPLAKRIVHDTSMHEIIHAR